MGGPGGQGAARALPKTDPAATRARIVATLAGLYRQYPDWSGHWFGTNPLAGQFPAKTRDWDPAGMEGVLLGLALGANDRDPGVRLQAIADLGAVGKAAVPLLRARMAKETDARDLTALAQTLGALGDSASALGLSALVQDSQRPEEVRTAALDALAMLGGPQALRARLMLVYDPKAPAPLVSRALILLGRDGALPANDIAGFLDHPSPAIRAAALLALSPKRPIPDEVKHAVVDRLSDPAPEVRKAAIEAAAQLTLREAIPRLVAVANEDASRTEATLALAALPDAQALPIYLAALQDRNPELRRRAEVALLAIRDRVAGDLERVARSGRLSGPAVLAVERVLTRFTPIVDWRVIGPFPRTTAQVFIGEPSIDFQRTHTGAEGHSIAWAARKADPATGRVVLDDFKGGAGDRGGFGYDTNGTPDLNAFGYAEVVSDRDRPALMLVGSSGTIRVTVNETMVHNDTHLAGRACRPTPIWSGSTSRRGSTGSSLSRGRASASGRSACRSRSPRRARSWPGSARSRPKRSRRLR